MTYSSIFLEQLAQRRTLDDDLPALAVRVDTGAQQIIQCFRKGGKVLTCGNGGSACDAIHLAEELLGRYTKSPRRSLPAVSLCADGAYLTCAANDFGFDAVFERALEGLGRAGDVLVGISTSGGSANVLRAFARAKTLGVTTIGLLGGDGGAAADACDLPIIVTGTTVTARIQEAHTLIIHSWCESVERHFG